jgi:Protein of unknown function (DUF3108)
MRIAMLAVVVGCAQRPAAMPMQAVARGEAALVAIPDEQMVFDVSFRGIWLARVSTALGHLGRVDGHRTVIAKTGGRTEGLLTMLGDLRWELTTTLDLDTGQAISSIEESWEDGHHHVREVDGGMDLHAAIATLRAGSVGEVEVSIGGGRFPVAVQLAGRDRLRMPALRYDGTADGKFPFSIWISDDADRVPLRGRVSTQWGDIGIELASYE